MDDTFSRPEGFELAAYWEQSTLVRYARIHEIRSSDGAWMTLSVYHQTLDTACQSILSYGPLLEVLEPEELRQQVKAGIAAMSVLYD